MTNMPNVPEMTEKYGFSAEYGFGTKDEQHNNLAVPLLVRSLRRATTAVLTDAIRNNMRLLYKVRDFPILDYNL